MKLVGGIAAFLLLLLAVSGAYALPSPTLTFIPDRFSENGSFLAIADPGVYDRSIRVTWISPGMGEADLGLFPRMGNKWVCYFSNKDKAAECGPTPFMSMLNSYEVTMKSADEFGNIGNRTVQVTVGGLKLTPSIAISGANVDLLIYPSGGLPTNVSFAVYDSDLVQKKPYSALTRDPNTGYFRGSTSLDKAGVYYVAFKANEGAGGFGGEVKKIVIGGLGGDGTIYGSIQSDFASFAAMMNKTQVYRRTGFKVKNIGSRNLTGLSASVNARIANRVSITFDKAVLRPNESTYFTVELKNMANAMNLTASANVTSNGTVVGVIPLRLDVSVLNECPGGTGPCICPPSASGFTITPAAFTGNFLEGVPASTNFTISNSGTAELTGLTSTASTGIGNAASVSLPQSVPAGGQRQIRVSLNPYAAGTYSGYITVSTSAGSQSILVAASFYEDITDGLEDSRTELESLRSNSSIDSSILDEIGSGLDDAESYMTSRDYKAAQEEYASASSKLSVLSDLVSIGYDPGTGPGTGPGVDMTLPLILVVAIVALVGILIYLKKFRKAGGGSDEEFEEELEEAGGGEEGY